MISDKTFNDGLQMQVETVLELLGVPQPELGPMIFCLFIANDKPGLAAHLYQLDYMPEGKSELMTALGRMFAEKHPGLVLVAVYSVLEAWITQDPNAPSPRLAQDRREIIAVNGSTENSRQNMATVEINRDDDGNIVPGEVRVTPYAPGSQNYTTSRLLTKLWTGYRQARQPKAKATQTVQPQASHLH